MIRVIEVKPDGRALIDTEGLYRIRLQPGGEIVDELLTAEEAQAFVETFNGCCKSFLAQAIGYCPSTASK